jgi:hypothetical protein
VPQGAIVENKHLGAALAFIREQQRQTPRQRSQKAPRRQGQFGHMFMMNIPHNYLGSQRIVDHGDALAAQLAGDRARFRKFPG